MEKEQTLPGYLKQLRRLCHYRQDYVASQLNIARQTYSHYETGRIKPPAEALYKLAGIYLKMIVKTIPAVFDSEGAY